MYLSTQEKEAYMYGKGVNAYRQTHVVTADPQKLIVMCYEGVIKNLRCARTAYELNDYETKGQSLTKAHDIVVFLIQSLDMEKGGDIARGLDALYNYILRRTMEGDLKKDMTVFDEAIGIFEELLSSWREISFPSQKGDHETVMPVRNKGTGEVRQILSGSIGA